MAKVSFDGVEKIISVTTVPVSGSIDIDIKIDIYSDWKEWVLVDDNSKYSQAMYAVGGDPLPGSKALGTTYFLLNGWKIRPYEGNHTLNMNGNLYCEDGTSPYITTIGAYNVMVISAVSSLVDSTVQQLPEIEHMAFNGMVYISVSSGTSGTAYPLGTLQNPVNNLSDAKLIAIERGFNILYVIGSLTVGATESITDYTLTGNGAENTTVVMVSGCITSRTTFENLSISGRQSGETHYNKCDIGALTNVHCSFHECRLIGPMTMHQSYGDTTDLYKCYTGDIAGATFVLDMNNSPVNMSFNDFNGKMQIINMNKATAGVITINMNAGKILIDSTCTTGQIKIRGVGEVDDQSTGTVVDNDALHVISIWEYASRTLTGDVTITTSQINELNSNILQTREGNIKRELNIAVAQDNVRNVAVGKLDSVTYYTKGDSDLNWNTPLSTKTVYCWYATLGDDNPIRVGEDG